MDVTSLLNASSGAKAQVTSRSQSPDTSERSYSVTSLDVRTSTQTSDDERTHKSRTPWNADGYSLPLSIDFKAPLHLKSRFRSPSERLESPISSSTESRESAHSRAASMDSTEGMTASNDATPPSQSFRSEYDARDGTPSSLPESLATERQSINRPRHKFSDSHSSLSSYASSVSGSHSRISSVTTVGGVTFENSLLDSKLAQLPESAEVPVLGSIHPPSPRCPGFQSNGDYTASSMNPMSRLLSPTELLSQSNSKVDSYFVPSKLHKRTVSAPNCTPAALASRMSVSKQAYPVLPPPHAILDPSRRQDSSDMSREQSPATSGSRIDQGEPRRRGSVLRHDTEPDMGDASRSLPRRQSSLSIHSEHGRSLSLDPTRSMSQGPAPIPEDAITSADMPLNAEACCMFVENCNTGSQLRKAISHLFGRNKNCTQRIPKHVWVYYCRKHYQRVRYRNAKTYPLTQMELVKVQVHRLQAWSEKNRSEGHGSFIESWEFSLRKREQKRLDSEAGPGDDSEDENGGGSGGSGVPSWIVDGLGKGYRTEQILDIVDRLYAELDQGRLTQVPEVEFLPNIVEEGNEGASKPARGRRNNSTVSNGPKTPKRKAPDVTATLEQGHRGYYGQQDEVVPGPMSPSEKRMRVERATDVSPRSHVPFMRPLENLPTRPGPNRYAHGAPQGVPRMHFGQGYYGPGPEEDRGHAQTRYPFNGHVASDEQGRAYFYELSSTYGHMPTQPDNAHEGAYSLPSMMPQHGPYAGSQRQPHRASSMASNGYGSHRPMHQRSASAFTLTDRRPYDRPSSPGREAHGGQYGFGHSVPSMPRYVMDAPRVFHGSHGPRQHGHSQSLSISHSPFHHNAMMHGDGHRMASPGTHGRG